MWHASVSVWSRDGSRKMAMPQLALKEAVKLLDGVGGDCEWWTFGSGPKGEHVGYLRVPVTEAEYAMCPAGIVTADAGDAGPRRARTRPRVDKGQDAGLGSGQSPSPGSDPAG